MTFTATNVPRRSLLKISVLSLGALVVAADILNIVEMRTTPAILLQGAIFIVVTILTWRNFLPGALGFAIAGLVLDLLVRVGQGVELSSTFPLLPFVGWGYVPLVGPLLFAGSYESAWPLAIDLISDLATLGGVVLAGILIAMLVATRRQRLSPSRLEEMPRQYCLLCGASDQAGFFCSKCGKALLAN